MEPAAKGLLLSCAPIVAGALMLVGSLYYWRQGREFRDQGVTTQATVLAKQRYTYGNIYVVEFTDLNGMPRTVEIKVRSTRGGFIKQGSRVPITYLPAHPEKAEMGRKWGAYISGWLALLVAAFGAGMCIYGLYLLAGTLTGKRNPANP